MTPHRKRAIKKLMGLGIRRNNAAQLVAMAQKIAAHPAWIAAVEKYRARGWEPGRSDNGT